MTKQTIQKVTFGPSAYVWCKGTSKELGRHPIYLGCPVIFTNAGEGKRTKQTCRHPSCSLCGIPGEYKDNEIGFQDGFTPTDKDRGEYPIEGCPPEAV